MSRREEPPWTEPDGPVKAVPRATLPLTGRQRATAVLIALGTYIAVALTAAGLRELAGSTLGDFTTYLGLFGGLLALPAVFLYLDRAVGFQCPRCGGRRRNESECPRCGYDLAGRPRFVCAEVHDVYLDPGVCDCGRRLHPLPPVAPHRALLLGLKFGIGLLASLGVVWLLVVLMAD